ncbi:spectrin alpha chain, non-erythrocytic 1-like [Limulus polyphemus]|uniref:Spectrin alpha chain, non-erythrocytic 1-like n=1 Tax=Limulus polyphemus TaxID=6850 RepID=A0ABM1BYJ9_LIMPO|nr:spectrin alpha chain, non-erythrocytic 1-like [Limulus polyphemus]
MTGTSTFAVTLRSMRKSKDIAVFKRSMIVGTGLAGATVSLVSCSKTNILEIRVYQWHHLKEALIDKRSKLGESQSLQQFSRDADEIENWIAEKIQIAKDESYRDPANIQSKHQKHQAFEAEIAANADRVQAVLGLGQNLIDKHQCAGSEEAVKARLVSLADQWEHLTQKSSEKNLKLKEVNKERSFNAAVKDLDFWLGEVDSLLETDDSGKDLASVQNLIKKHQLVEADITVHEDRIKDMNNLADGLVESGQFDSASVQERRTSINERYERVKTLAAYRRSRLDEAYTLHQFFRDIADEESWIKEKKLLVGSDDYGRDLTGVQNLRKKHKRFEAELASHEPAIQDVQEAGQKLMAESNIGVPEIEQRLKALAQAWQELKEVSNDRGNKLEESLTYQQFLAKVEEEEAWISEKQQLLSVEDYGDNMAAVQGLLKKHEAFECDFAVHRERCGDITQAGDQLIADGNHHADSIRQRLQQLQDRLNALEASTIRRKGKLKDNSAYLQFMWKADVVESWIADKEVHLRSEDYGRDLSSIQTLLTKQETFDAGLQAFEQEGIQSITQLKEELLVGNHDNTSSIVKRHDDVMTRWHNLMAASEARKHRLLTMQDQFKQIEDLFLTFAKKASAFNSWFENAEEDLTDPVRCNSIEEIRALREAHSQFQASLSSAQLDFDALAALDQEIKNFNVGSNPYTWFTMEALEETWRNLQKIIENNSDSFMYFSCRNQSGVSEDALKEFSMMFRHFDREKIGKLNHYQFKSCLRALGYDLPMVDEGQPDPEFEAILNVVDPNRDGFVSLQEYMAFMISRETENVRSSEDIENAFRAITSGDRPYVTADDLYANLTVQMADYCVSHMKPYVEPKSGRTITGAYDYVEFTRLLFQK